MIKGSGKGTGCCSGNSALVSNGHQKTGILHHFCSKQTGWLQQNHNVMESPEGKSFRFEYNSPAAGAGASNQIRLRGQVGFAGADNSLIVLNGLL